MPSRVQHWQIPLSKRFRSLKLWFVIRNYGVSGLQKHIREGVRLAQKFEALVLADQRFEIPAARHLGEQFGVGNRFKLDIDSQSFSGMVVFRLKGENELTEKVNWKTGWVLEATLFSDSRKTKVLKKKDKLCNTSVLFVFKLLTGVKRRETVKKSFF